MPSRLTTYIHHITSFRPQLCHGLGYYYSYFTNKEQVIWGWAAWTNTVRKTEITQMHKTGKSWGATREESSFLSFLEWDYRINPLGLILLLEPDVRTLIAVIPQNSSSPSMTISWNMKTFCPQSFPYPSDMLLTRSDQQSSPAPKTPPIASIVPTLFSSQPKTPTSPRTLLLPQTKR